MIQKPEITPIAENEEEDIDEEDSSEEDNHKDDDGFIFNEETKNDELGMQMIKTEEDLKKEKRKKRLERVARAAAEALEKQRAATIAEKAL